MPLPSTAQKSTSLRRSKRSHRDDRRTRRKDFIPPEHLRRDKRRSINHLTHQKFNSGVASTPGLHQLSNHYQDGRKRSGGWPKSATRDSTSTGTLPRARGRKNEASRLLHQLHSKIHPHWLHHPQLRLRTNAGIKHRLRTLLCAFPIRL